MATFEGYERREAKILSVLKEYGINSIDECKTICEEKGIDRTPSYRKHSRSALRTQSGLTP